MTNIFLYGVMAEDNFGGPSLIHGAHEIIKTLHNNDYEIVCYQRTEVVDSAVADMPFPVLSTPYRRALPLLIDGLKTKIGMRVKQQERVVFWRHLTSSDIVCNLYGICFCSNLEATARCSYIRSIRRALGTFLISLMAKMHGKKSVKSPASYGPINSKNTRAAARFVAKRVFDIMLAREVESERQMREVAGVLKRIRVCPDMANMMQCDAVATNNGTVIGISVSHQIIRQWKSHESYIACLAGLVEHIQHKCACNVVLIPNEVSKKIRYNDAHVAEDILNAVSEGSAVTILDSSEMTSTKLKTAIGHCDALVSSRYHSCVAGLSSGVPTLVLGWHYKYADLLRLYGQDKWLISSDNCSAQILIDAFDQFWDHRHIARKEIADNTNNVRRQLLETGKLLFVK